MMTENKPVQAKESKGLFWPIFLATLLVVSTTGYLTMVMIAANDPSFAVEKDYYQRALRWDQERKQHWVNQDLGWKLDLVVKPSGKRGVPAILNVNLRDKNSKPLKLAMIKLVAFHNARAADKFSATFKPHDGSYQAQLGLKRPGLWEFRFDVRREKQRFTHVIRRMVQP